MSIKISKISYFSFTFTLNKKEKVPWYRGRGQVKKIIAEGGMLSLIVVLEIFQKIKGDGELVKNWVEKI